MPIWDGEPRAATSTSTQLLSSEYAHAYAQVKQAHKPHSMFCSSAPFSKKHGHSSGPKEPRMQKALELQRRRAADINQLH